MLQGAQRKIVSSASDAKAQFDQGLRELMSHESDAGGEQEHTAVYFTITVHQYWPSAKATGDERVVVAYLCFVQSPGAERLAMDPALLRIREGPTLNQSLVTFTDSIQVCCLLRLLSSAERPATQCLPASSDCCLSL